MGEPTGPIENGSTYMVRPRMVPVKSPLSVRRISYGSHPVVGGTRVALGQRANKDSVLHARHVARVTLGKVAARPQLLVQPGERAPFDHLRAQGVVFLLRTVHPVDRLGLEQHPPSYPPHLSMCLFFCQRSRRRETPAPAPSAVAPRGGGWCSPAFGEGGAAGGRDLGTSIHGKTASRNQRVEKRSDGRTTAVWSVGACVQRSPDRRGLRTVAETAPPVKEDPAEPAAVCRVLPGRLTGRTCPRTEFGSWLIQSNTAPFSVPAANPPRGTGRSRLVHGLVWVAPPAGLRRGRFT